MDTKTPLLDIELEKASDSNVGWLLRNWCDYRPEVPLTEGHSRCLDTLCAVERIYNLLPVKDEAKGFHFKPYDRLDVDLGGGSLSTYDSDALTRLVKRAHKNYVRVEISSRLVPLLDPDEDDWGWRGEFQDWDEMKAAEGSHLISALHIGLNARKPEVSGDNFWERHPGPEALKIKESK